MDILDSVELDVFAPSVHTFVDAYEPSLGSSLPHVSSILPLLLLLLTVHSVPGVLLERDASLLACMVQITRLVSLFVECAVFCIIQLSGMIRQPKHRMNLVSHFITHPSKSGSRRRR